MMLHIHKTYAPNDIIKGIGYFRKINGICSPSTAHSRSAVEGDPRKKAKSLDCPGHPEAVTAYQPTKL